MIPMPAHPRSRFIKRFFAHIAVWLCGLGGAFGQAPSAFPVTIVPGPRPWPVVSEGSTYLLYELNITNCSPLHLKLEGVEVLSEGGEALAQYTGADLTTHLHVIGPEDSGAAAEQLAGGRAVILFVDLRLKQGATAPPRLKHRLRFSFERGGQRLERTLTGGGVLVRREPVPLIHSPLSGPGWVAFNGLAAADHRRTVMPIDGHAHDAQRFAIDWMCLGPDGKLLQGDPGRNESYYCYGKPLLAVADARVVSVQDTIPDNPGNNPAESRSITLANIIGNYVVLDIGKGCFALYGHLKPGSVRVKPGQRVKVGEVVGQLGNSGNSDAPHLHFHLTDGPSPLASEGIPYVLPNFTRRGVTEDPAVLEGWQWLPKAESVPSVRQNEFPADRALVDFPAELK